MASVDGLDRSNDLSGRPMAELIQETSELVSRLVTDELALARAELSQKAKHAGIGAGLAGTAGLLAAYALGALVAALILGLAEWMPAWAAALVAAAIVLLIAGLLGLLGRQQFERATPLVPEEAVASVKADLDEITRRVRQP
ncbi:MAG: phage holin family protein [Actinomycetes bacterium]|jgi:MFS family permease|nr:phage holin family protein [Actinomycetes bacterium]